MEIVAVLSTIILIVTSFTTLLAVVAYILYKIRERKQRLGDHKRPEKKDHKVLLTAAQPQLITPEIDNGSGDKPDDAQVMPVSPELTHPAG